MMEANDSEGFKISLQNPFVAVSCVFIFTLLSRWEPVEEEAVLSTLPFTSRCARRKSTKSLLMQKKVLKSSNVVVYIEKAT